MRARSREEAGFTIMELMIVAAIFGLIMVTATLSLKNLTRADLRSAAGKTAASMRYIFDRAAMTGNYMRLAMDLKKGHIWAEWSEDLISLRAGRDQHVLEGGEKDASAEARAMLKGNKASRQGGSDFLGSMLGLGGDDDLTEDDEALDDEQFAAGLNGKMITEEAYLAGLPVLRPKASFKPLKNIVARTVKLASGIKIASVITPRLTQATTSGMAYVYFFPQGHSEPAVIYFTEKDDPEKVYSVVLHPLTGRAVVYPCEYDVPDDFGVSDDKRKSRKGPPCKKTTF